MDQGGHMACPGCGKSQYSVELRDGDCVVSCDCGWVGYYCNMLETKKLSDKGFQRMRRK